MEFFKPEDFYPELDQMKAYAFLLANKMNRLLLERAIEVTGGDYSGNGWAMFEKKPHLTPARGHTHRALLIGVEPIEKDSAEKVLKDLINWLDIPEMLSKNTRQLIDRAKRVLGEG